MEGVTRILSWILPWENSLPPNSGLVTWAWHRPSSRNLSNAQPLALLMSSHRMVWVRAWMAWQWGNSKELQCLHPWFDSRGRNNLQNIHQDLLLCLHVNHGNFAKKNMLPIFSSGLMLGTTGIEITPVSVVGNEYSLQWVSYDWWLTFSFMALVRSLGKFMDH